MAFSAVTERGSISEKVSDTSLGVSPSAAITVGKIVFAVLAFDNIALVDGATTTNDTLTDTDGHTWNKVCERTNTAAGVEADGVTGALWWTKVTSEIGTGDTVTFNIDSAVTAKCIGLFEVTVGAGNTIQLAAGGSTFLEDDTANPGALSLSGLASKEYLFLGVAWRETNTTNIAWTEDADYTNVYTAEGFGSVGGGAATNVLVNIGYRIATLTGDTFDIGGLTSTQNALALLAFEEVAGGTTGTIAVTQADQTSSISGSVSVSGTIAVTQAGQTSSIAALETFLGTIAVTQADQTSAISGVVANPVTGTIAVTQADQTSAITALETFTGTIAVTQADQTSDISGTVGAAGVTGTIAVTQADQTSAISGLETITGTIAVTQADQVAAFAGTSLVNITGSIAVTQADQIAAFAGIVANPVTGTISVTQADQVMSAAGLLIISGSIVVTQADQTFTASGVVANPVTGTIAVTQANQIAGWTGFVGAITFWQRNPAGYTLNPAAYVPVGADDDPPW